MKQEFESDSAEEDADYGIDFILAAINKPQVVENIFYDFDKATLRPESKSALDEMVVMLNENPNVTIEMGAHTDRKGSRRIQHTPLRPARPKRGGLSDGAGIDAGPLALKAMAKACQRLSQRE